MLLGELGQLHQLGDDLLDIVAVRAVHQGGGHRVQDGLVRGLETEVVDGDGGGGWGQEERKPENKPLLPRGSLAWLARPRGRGTGSARVGRQEFLLPPSTAPRACMDVLWVFPLLCAPFKSPVGWGGTWTASDGNALPHFCLLW